jgi:hypothetical protein
MAPEKERKAKYESPIVVKLNEVAVGYGAKCSTGTGQLGGDCSTGNGASNNNCKNGTGAKKGGCATGTGVLT